ncbi:MAG: 50S ribosomal protein L30 [Acidimicrobiales bacterium]
MGEPSSSDIVVRQVRSAIGSKPKHRGTLRALGLGRIGKSRRLPDRPEIRGMIARVPHLVRVEAVPDPRTWQDGARSASSSLPSSPAAGAPASDSEAAEEVAE